MKIKEWYTAQELANLQLNSIPQTKAGVIYQAKKSLWSNRKRSGRGGGVEYAFDGLPIEVQNEIKARQLRELVRAPSRVSSDERVELAKVRDVGSFDGNQRRIADARMMMALLVGQSQSDMGCGRTVAIDYVSKLSRGHALPTINGVDYNQVCAIAVAKSNKKVGVGTRKLHQWVIDADKCQNGVDALALLAPERQGRPVIEVSEIEWLPYFLAVYRKPVGLSITRAYEIFAYEYSKIKDMSAVPSLAQVRVAFKKLPKLVQLRGRVTGSRYKQLQSYVRRNWNPDWMFANDVWVGDGHAMKLKVRHPIHGQEFMPEMTLIMDAASRYIVGWSLSLSESHLAVADALRHAMTTNGVPAIYYSDNGSGQSNDVMDNPMTGILPRIGVEHATGIPGNPQGRGIIERAMKEVPSRVAQRFATYFGAGSDTETNRKNLYAVASYSSAIAKGKTEDELTAIQQKGNKILPTWRQLLDAIDEEVHRYNHFHVHRQIGTTPAKKRDELIEQMATQDEKIVPLSELEARELFRPTFARVVERGRVRYENGFYGDEALEFYDGQTVLVGVDIHDASTVLVKTEDDKFICVAQLDWKSCDAFPKSFTEKARAKREAGIKRRAQAKIDKIKAENKKVIEHKDLAVFGSNVIEGRYEELSPIDDDEFILFEHQKAN